MSSCNALPHRCEIRPIKTIGCAFKRSCNGASKALQDFCGGARLSVGVGFAAPGSRGKLSCIEISMGGVGGAGEICGGARLSVGVGSAAPGFRVKLSCIEVSMGGAGGAEEICGGARISVCASSDAPVSKGKLSCIGLPLGGAGLRRL